MLGLIKLTNSIKKMRSEARVLNGKEKQPDYNRKQLWISFDTCFKRNKINTLKWLMYLRDINNGLGEREIFRLILKRLCQYYPFDASAFLKTNIPSYGRWDDLLWLYCNIDNNYIKDKIIKTVHKQLNLDKRNLCLDKPVSLLGKWLYSENTSSKTTKRYARTIRVALKMSSKEYRKLLSALRKRLNLVEVNLSQKNFENINYNKVPIVANNLYKNAFKRNDKKRREEYLQQINTTQTNQLIDIINKYDVKKLNESLEQQWKDCSKKNDNNFLIVYDDRKSMLHNITNNISYKDISTMLSIYFAEQHIGVFNNKLFGFSKAISLKNKKTLLEKINAITYDGQVNANVIYIFKYILSFAIKSSVPKEEMPKKVLFITNKSLNVNMEKLTEIVEQYKDKGYDIPKCVIWNLRQSKTNVPMKAITKHCVCLYGFTDKTLNYVLNDNIDPYMYLVNKLKSSQYYIINKIYRKVRSQNDTSHCRF